MRQYCILTAVLVLAACSNPTERITSAAPQTVVEPIFGTLYSNIREPRRMVIHDEATWAQLWGEMVSTGSAPATAPDVDFSREDVVVAAMGERRAAGYNIAIENVATTATGALRIDVASTIPSPACAASDVITTPLDAVRVPKTADPVQFSEKTVVMSC